MRFPGILLRRPVADMALDNDQRRPAGLALKLAQRHLHGRAIIGIAQAQHVPAIGQEAGADILAERQRGRTLDGDAVGIIDPAQIGQPQMPGQRRGLAGNALIHAAVAAKGIHIMIYHRIARTIEMRRHPALGDRHAHAVRIALAQRPGGRLHARGHAVFRVARRHAVQLAEMLDVVQGNGGVIAPCRPCGWAPARASDAAAHIAAWRHGPRTAQSGRGSANADRPGQSAADSAKPYRQPAPGPSACRDARISPSAPHPSPKCGLC